MVSCVYYFYFLRSTVVEIRILVLACPSDTQFLFENDRDSSGETFRVLNTWSRGVIGSTSDFDSDCLGSNPDETAILPTAAYSDLNDPIV